MFEIGQLIRVVTQPPKMHVTIQGEVAFIDDTRVYEDGEAWASIRALRLDGETSGGGSVPMSCLALCTDPDWVAAYETYKVNWAKEQADRLAYSKRWRAKYDEALRLTAEEHGITPVQVEAIVNSFNARAPA